MERQHLQKQNQSISTTPNIKELKSSILTIPSYTPVFVENSQNKKSHIGQSIKQDQIQKQNQQSKQIVDQNQRHLLQSISLTKSLPQSFASTQFQIATQPQQKQNFLYEQQNNQSTRQQESQKQLSSNLFSSKQHHSISFTSEKIGNQQVQKQSNHEDNKQVLQMNSQNNEFLSKIHSTQMSPYINSESISQTQTSKFEYEQTTPKKIYQNPLSYQSLINKYSQSAQNTERKFENTQSINMFQSKSSKVEQKNQSINNNIYIPQKPVLPSFSKEEISLLSDTNRLNQINQSCIQLNGGSQEHLNQYLIKIPNSKQQMIKTQDDYFTSDINLSLEEVDNFKHFICKTEESQDGYHNSPYQMNYNQNSVKANKSQIKQSFKLPLEFVHNRVNIAESQYNQDDIKIQNQQQIKNDYQPQLNKFKIIEENKSLQHSIDDSKDYTNILEEELQKLNQENQILKNQLSDQQNEYKALLLKYQDIEKKYLTLQNQNSQSYSSCNSSVIIQKEDKNQNYLHDLVNTQSFSKMSCVNLPLNNRRQSNNYTYIKRKNSAFKKYEPLSKTSMPLFNDYQTQNSLKVFDTYNNGMLENINNMYKSLGTDTQVHTSNRIQPSSPSLIIEEDYNYKKNNNNKIDPLIQNQLNKTQYSPIKSLEKKLYSDIKQLSNSISSILEEPYHQKQKHNPLYTSRENYNTSNLNQNSQKSTSEQSSYLYNSIYNILENKNKLSTDKIKNTTNNTDEILRNSYEDKFLEQYKIISQNKVNTIHQSPK